MRLTEQDAEFVCATSATSLTRLGAQLAGANGVMFQCPKCSVGRERGEEAGRRYVIGAHYAICFFSNPQNAPPLPPEWWPKIARWTMTGTSLADLTLRPSILFSPPGCAWHGYITNGDLHE